FLINKFYKDSEPIDLFTGNSEITQLITYINDSMSNIDSIKNDKIQVTIDEDNSLESIKRVLFLGNDNNIPINKLGSGIQYANMIPLNIISNLINRSRFEKSFEEIIQYDNDDKKYVEFV